jgi:hypothetical protein
MTRRYRVTIKVEKQEVYEVDAKDDADLIKECQFSHLQKKSSNVKYIETKNEIRQLGGWKDVSNVSK